MKYSFLEVYRAHLIRKNKLFGKLCLASYVVRVDFRTNTGDDWIDHWML